MCIVILLCYEVNRQLPHDLNEHVEMTLERKRTLLFTKTDNIWQVLSIYKTTLRDSIKVVITLILYILFQNAIELIFFHKFL